MSWQDDTVVEERNQLNAARKQFSESGSEEDKKLLENSKKNLDSTYVGVEEKYIKEKVSNIQSASQSMQSSLAWATMNKMTGRTTSNPDEEIKKIAHTTLPIETGPFTNEELQNVLQKMPSRKAAGLDEVPAEVWKTGRFNNILIEICNGTLLDGKKPQEWSTSGIVPIPKKGDLSKATNC